jgi:methyl-accepting chemotaxis protein
MKYGKDGYFWINDEKSNILAHPNSELKGKNLGTLLEDKNGVSWFKNGTEEAIQKGSSYVSYNWEDREKVSFFYYFKDWKWIIGTGLYTDEIEKKIMQMQEISKDKIGSIILSIVISSLVVAILSFLLFLSFQANIL